MISAIIVSHNSREQLRVTLERVQALPDAPDEIIVVDNASRDGSPEMVRRDFAQVRLLDLRDNLGFGAANNRGARIAAGDSLLLLNSDAWPTPGSLKRLVATLESDPRLGLVAPLLFFPDGRPQFHWAPTTGILGETLQLVRNRLESWAPIHRLRLGGWYTAACVLLRRQAFEAINGFDEDFFLYFEDVDLCRRLVAQGYKLATATDAHAVHVKGGSQGGSFSTLEYRRSQLTYYRKHRPLWENRLLRAKLRRKFERTEGELRTRLLDLLGADTSQ